MPGEPSAIPAGWRWNCLTESSGVELEIQYQHTLEPLAREAGLVGVLFLRRAEHVHRYGAAVRDEHVPARY